MKLIDYYAVLLDSNTQWFSYIIKYNIDQTIIHDIVRYDLNGITDAPFLQNIYSREPNQTRVIIRSDSYYLWSISEYEFNRLREIVSLLPAVQKYKKLINL